MTAFHPHLVARRLRVAELVLWTAVAVLVVAFFRAQILEHGKYQLQSETNRLRPIPLPAPRGIITDRNGKIIAENVPGYTVSVLPGAEATMVAEKLLTMEEKLLQTSISLLPNFIMLIWMMIFHTMFMATSRITPV